MSIPAAKPTRVRYIVLTLTVVVAVLLYLDRYCLGYVTPYVRESLKLTSGQTGFMLSAFFLTYAFGQLPGGWLADRFGTRWMLSFYLAAWSVLTGLTGFADTFAMILLLRLGCGVFEAGAYPACAGLIRRWFPYQQRGLASGIVSFGGRIGGAITPTVTGACILFFMPVYKSSLLSDSGRDLLDPRGLAREVLLLDADEKTPPMVRQFGTYLQGRMTLETRRTFDEIAARPADEGPPDDRVLLMTDSINRWLEDPHLAENIDVETLKPRLTRQALQLLAEEDRGDIDMTTRLNRNLFEVIYPGKIRQVLGDGWPPVLMIYGVIGVAVAVVFFLFHRDTPRQHFLTNGAEADLAEAYEKVNEDGVPPMPASVLWRSILTDRSLWASSIVQFGTNFGWIILGNQLALYLFEVHRTPEGVEKQWMVSLPFLLALPTLLIGGWWTDWMTKKYGARVGRCFPIAATRFATAIAFVACYFLDGAWPVVIALCVMSIVHDLGLPAIWGYNLDVGKRNVGLVLGWGNMWGNLGAFVSPIVLLPLTDAFATKQAGYEALFLVCSAVFILIGFVSLFIDAGKPIGETPVVVSMDGSTGIRAGDPPIRPSDR